MAHYKNMEKGIPQKASFHHLFTANVYDGGCKRLRWRLQTFAVPVANVCGEDRQIRCRILPADFGPIKSRGRKAVPVSHSGSTSSSLSL